MARYGFTSPGAEAGNAIQQFLVQRAMQQRQAILDAANEQQRQREAAQQAADLQLRQQSEKRLEAQQQADAEIAKTQAADTAKQRDFGRATTIAENAVPGTTDQATFDLLNANGYGGLAKKIPGVVSQGPQTGEDANGVPQYQVNQTPDTYQLAGGEKYQSARIAAQEKEAEAKAARDAANERATADRQSREQIAKLAASKGDEGIVAVQTVDAEGRPVTQYMRKGDALKQGSFDKPQGQTVQNRIESAKAVTQTGQDIIDKLSDPAYIKNVGVAMGRYNSVRDFIGNPPPEYADLAGNIESFALANMGVHGMRSTQGAEMIKQLLDQKHTPEALIAAVKGLSNFSQHFIDNTSGASARPSSTSSAVGKDAAARAAELINKYGGR